MENITRRSFNLNLVTLRLLGLYPRKQHSVLYVVYGYVLLCCCLIPDSILSLLYYVKDEELGLMDAGFNLFIIMGLLSYFLKLLPFIADNESIRECLYFLETSTSVSLNERQRIIVEESVWVCKRNSTFFFSCLVFDCISLGFSPLFLSQREYPMEVWLPFDATTNTFLFCTAYVFVGMGVLYATMASGIVDPLIAGLAYLAAGQIKVLKDKLQFLHEDVDHHSETIYERIQQCIQYHHSIIRYVNKIESSFSFSIFYQFIGSTFIICFGCLEISKLELASVDAVLMIFYFFSVILELYFYCYYGTIIYEESKTLVTAAYMGPWYKYDLRSQKALLIFMERAKIPMSVRVGKVFDLNLGTFTEILKKSYSFLAVLKNY